MAPAAFGRAIASNLAVPRGGCHNLGRRRLADANPQNPMNSCRKSFAMFLTACFLAVAAFAADASPAGTWKWMQPGRGGGAGVERVLMLEHNNGKLTGTLKGAQMGQYEIPDLDISSATYKDGVIAFSVESERNGNKYVSKYQGKLAGDTITGTSERQGRDGQVTKADWVAKRAK